MNQGKWEFCKLSDPAMISLICNIACVEIYTTIGVPRWLISIQASCHRSVRPVDISREIFCLFGVAHHCTMLLSPCKIGNREFESDYHHRPHFHAIQLFQRKYLGFKLGAVSLS